MGPRARPPPISVISSAIAHWDSKEDFVTRTLTSVPSEIPAETVESVLTLREVTLVDAARDSREETVLSTQMTVRTNRASMVALVWMKRMGSSACVWMDSEGICARMMWMNVLRIRARMEPLVVITSTLTRANA